MKRLTTHIILLTAIIISFTSILKAESIVYGKNGKLKKEILPVPYFQKVPQATLTGWDFMLQADKMDVWDLQDKIVEVVLQGNVPGANRNFRKLVYKTPVVDSVEILRKPHTVELWILTEYISIGTDDNCVRMPMGPLAAQVIADSLNCILPTAYIVDRIAEASTGHLEIFPFRPLGDRNCQPIVFQDSNNAINAFYKERGYKFGDLISGLKKDVVLTYKIHTLPGNENRVAIYGWHIPDGSFIQPLYVKHVNYYVDYSHGIRMVYRKIKVDGKEYDAKEVLESPQLYRLLSDEPMHLQRATYEGFPKWYPRPTGKTISRIQERDTILIGTTGDYRPLTFKEPLTGEHWGFGIEIAGAIAKELGVEVKFIGTSWPTLTADVLGQTQMFDLAIGGITITEARCAAMLMSDGYLGNGKTILCRASDAGKFKSLKDIDKPHIRVMVNPGGLNEKFANANFTNATIMVHPRNEEIPALIAEGKADIMITEITEAPYYVKTDTTLAAPLLDRPFTRGEIGVLMRKGQEDLLLLVNDVIKRMKRDGSLQKLHEKYGLVYRY